MGREPVRRWIAGILMLGILLSLTACASSRSGDGAKPDKESSSESDIEETGDPAAVLGSSDSGNGKILIVYFTWAENAAEDSEADAVSSASVLPPGNVAQMAEWIRQETGGDLFSIRVEEPYSADYDACLDRASREKAENARPKLVEKAVDIADYDTVFLGYPNWWYSAPMAVFSFLEENDLADKKVVLFCSHGTGGLASSVKDISAVLPDSTVESNVLGIYRDDIPESQEKIKNWLNEIGY